MSRATRSAQVQQLSDMNPVYAGYLADPFVLAYQGQYYAYGTDSVLDGRVFQVLQSPDLIRWTSLGTALKTLEGEPCDYWAPEVALNGDTFYMYYSVGKGDKGHMLRVATAKAPQGPFTDLGLCLTADEPFAIDPHPFQDDDGAWYLFYAKDFLEGERVGTGLVVDRLEGMTRLVGETRTVLRATADWQLYKRQRKMYGRTLDWYTLEGPFVVKRFGRYYCFFSGGNWQNESYGVSYAVAPHPLGPWREPHPESPALLKSVEDALIGPGHNSLIVGPGDEDRLVFHAWNRMRTARQMWIGRLHWMGEEPKLIHSL